MGSTSTPTRLNPNGPDKSLRTQMRGLVGYSATRLARGVDPKDQAPTALKWVMVSVPANGGPATGNLICIDTCRPFLEQLVNASNQSAQRRDGPYRWWVRRYYGSGDGWNPA